MQNVILFITWAVRNTTKKPLNNLQLMITYKFHNINWSIFSWKNIHEVEEWCLDYVFNFEEQRGSSASACQTNMKHKRIASTMGLHSWCFLTLIRCESCKLFSTSSVICYPEESGPEIKWEHQPLQAIKINCAWPWKVLLFPWGERGEWFFDVVTQTAAKASVRIIWLVKPFQEI